MLVLFVIAAVSATSAEAEMLGRQLAANGSLVTLLPAIMAKETEEVITQHPELSAADRKALRQTGRDVAASGRDRLVEAFGHQYAAALSTEDLKALVAFEGGPAAVRYREAMPQVTIKGLATLGTMDFKSELARAFCSRTKKLCGVH
ncbi:MAG: hypothetical protein NVS3B5_15330 [Sphingomicrobium sp.]